MPILKALKHDTIFECVFELRFSPTTPSAADLLPGLMFGALKQHFQTTATLPFGQVPRALRDQDPNFAYQPSYSLEGKNSRLLLGQRVAALSFPRPYPGWATVKGRIEEMVAALLNTGLVETAERAALKYTNLLTKGTDALDSSQLRLEVRVGDLPIRRAGFMFNFEVERNGCTSIVQIIPGATIELKTPAHTERAEGVLFSVDTVRAGPFSDIKLELPTILDAIHTTEKEIYVACVTPATLEKLGPTWA